MTELNKRSAKHLLNSMTVFVAVLFLSACGSNSTKKQTDHTADTNTQVAIDTLTETSSTDSIPAPSTCNCTPLKREDNHWEYISFSRWMMENDKKEYDSLFRMYTHDSVRMKIKILGFAGFPEIPAEFKVFKNVERLVITGTGDFHKKNPVFKGPELFPKLNSIDFWGCGITLDSNDAWLKKLERLFLGKALVKGITAFRQMPKLKVLEIGHAGFEYTPQDINALTCLQELNIEEYKFAKGDFPVRNMDLNQFPCLKKARFWGGVSGLPQNIDSVTTAEVIVRHWLLNEEEKKKYEAYKKRFKQRKKNH